MDIEKAISLENLNQYKKNTSEKIKSYVDTKTSVIQDGTKTVGGISTDDYNAFKSAVEDSHSHSNMSVLDEIDESVVKGGNSLSGSTGYSVNDSIEYPLVGLKVYGKSTQDGTPTPENPVEIVSVENPTVTVCGKNLLKPTLETTTQNGVTCTKNADGTYTLNGTATVDTVFYLTGKNTLNKNVSYKLVGCPKNGSSSTYKLDLFDDVNKIFYPDFGEGKTLNFEENKVLSNTRIVVYSGAVCNNLIFKPMITTDLTATYDDFEPYKGSALPLSDTLNAIPVSSGGNVTIDGQEYIADYVDFERGG